MHTLYAAIEAAVAYIREHKAQPPDVAIILGTGLGNFGDRVNVTHRIKYEAIEGFPTASVQGHAGELLLGEHGGKHVAIFSGRAHAYEGHSLQEVTFPVRVAKGLGAQALFITNAAGGMNPLHHSGDLMLITDHINFTGDNPLIGPNDDRLGPRFPDMCEPYAQHLQTLAEQCALELQIPLRQGVYLGCTGPNLETRAEYRMMRGMGSDAVGMSTVHEVIVAVHAGLPVLGISVITDECFPDALEPVDLEKIIATANAAEPKLADLLLRCIERL